MFDKPTMTTTQEMGPCPACGKPLIARVEMSVDLGEATHAEGDVVPKIAKTLPATARLTGLHVSHDCFRKASSRRTGG